MADFDVSPQVRDIVGTGLRAPFSFGSGKGVRSVSVSNGLEKIQASIRQILMTRPGERIMTPEFGSRLYDMIFEPSDPATNYLLSIYTAEALRRWEPRIEVTAVNFLEDEANPNSIAIMVSFTVLATHEAGSFVFPYERRSMPMDQAVTGSESRRIFAAGTVLPAETPAFQNIGSVGGR